MSNSEKTNAVLLVLAAVLIAVALKFSTGFGVRAASPARIPLVDTQFLDTATFRKSYAELIRTKADLSDFDCYACHTKGKPPTLRFDAQQILIIPKEHEDIVMGHGSHNRNNNCFNCHDEQNLELLQTRDGHQVKLAESPRLCGSCHGPTYRDWEAGAHGRTGGYWDRSAGPMKRQICVDCHDPHHPKIPQRKPAPGPHLLHPEAKSETRNPKAEGNPKPEARNHRPRREAERGLTLSVAKFAPRLPNWHCPKPAGSEIRPSGFGLPSDFGLRVSDFYRRTRV